MKEKFNEVKGKLFENPGRSMQKLGKLFFWVGAILAAIYGVIFFLVTSVNGIEYGQYGMIIVGLLLGVIIIAVSVAVLYLTVLSYIAQGQLVENSYRILAILQEKTEEVVEETEGNEEV